MVFNLNRYADKPAWRNVEGKNIVCTFENQWGFVYLRFVAGKYDFILKYVQRVYLWDYKKVLCV